MLDLSNHSHKRLNLLTGEWVLVSPHRAKRPWQGQQERLPAEDKPSYDPSCYLCPGNKRAGDQQNPAYTDVFVFTNDFSALLPDVPSQTLSEQDLLVAKGEPGICRVICFSPYHDKTLPELDLPALRKVVDTWGQEFKQLGDRPNIVYVQIFENKGEMMGSSNPHPHGQIWATSSLPQEIVKESLPQLQYFEKHQRTLLSAYLDMELKTQTRIVDENDSFVVLVPFWAVWPFETLIISRRPVQNLLQLSDKEKDDLANILRHITIRYDNLFQTSFPYSAGLHQAPTDGLPHWEWHLHMHFYPPLLRSATVRKFMVGFELLGNPQRDITPETAAERLRQCSLVYYKSQLN
jgi:UDPglucose--hexose-1-phosphate uridylyltransferase